jgi:hypothetical protein
MRYTVTWHPDAEKELARIWLEAVHQQAVAFAANEMDRELSSEPERKGQEFFGDRILVVPPLAVTFSVSHEDRLVRVLQAWSK